jgi:photosystem II stability/assembly factor-like uncharacterized protein
MLLSLYADTFIFVVPCAPLSLLSFLPHFSISLPTTTTTMSKAFCNVCSHDFLE